MKIDPRIDIILRQLIKGIKKVNNIKLKGFLIRFLFSIALVFLTYNPSGYSYVDWVKDMISSKDNIPLVLLVGVVLIIGWLVYLRATLRSLGAVGVTLATALFACFVWLMVDLGMLKLNDFTVIAWVVLTIISIILAIGMSWSFIRRKISGQVDVDDSDN